MLFIDVDKAYTKVLEASNFVDTRGRKVSFKWCVKIIQYMYKGAVKSVRTICGATFEFPIGVGLHYHFESMLIHPNCGQLYNKYLRWRSMLYDVHRWCGANYSN